MKRLFIALLIIVFFGTVSQVGADIIYTNFNGSSLGARNDSAWGLTAALAPEGSGHHIDMAFAFTTPSINYYLDSISASIYMGCDSCQNVLDFGLSEDRGGKPGDSVEIFHLTNAMEPRLYPYYPIIANSVLHPVLNADTQYWIYASAAGGDTFALWARTLRTPGAAVYRFDSGEWISFIDTDIGAFQIVGTPVPEPSSILLLIFGLVGILLIREAHGRPPEKRSF